MLLHANDKNIEYCRVQVCVCVCLCLCARAKWTDLLKAFHSLTYRSFGAFCTMEPSLENQN